MEKINSYVSEESSRPAISDWAIRIAISISNTKIITKIIIIIIIITTTIIIVFY